MLWLFRSLLGHAEYDSEGITAAVSSDAFMLSSWPLHRIEFDFSDVCDEEKEEEEAAEEEDDEVATAIGLTFDSHWVLTVPT